MATVRLALDETDGSIRVSIVGGDGSREILETFLHVEKGKKLGKISYETLLRAGNGAHEFDDLVAMEAER